MPTVARAHKVVHITPQLFGDGDAGLVGGGERYPLELARAQAELTSVRLVTFGPRRRHYRAGELQIDVLPTRRRLRGSAMNPVSELLFPAIARSSVVHIHQLESALTDTALLAARLFRRRTYVTDHGGTAPTLLSPSRRAQLIHQLLAVSEFSSSFYPELSDRTAVIYGGVDPTRFYPDPRAERAGVLYVGRIMPHKGIDVLVRAIPPGVELRIFGRRYDREYDHALRTLADGKSVRFVYDADDDQILHAYQRARVLVLPSVSRSTYIDYAPKTELLGLVLLEAMACGTPVICSDAGAMHEVVSDGQNGHVVPAGDVDAFRAAITRCIDGGDAWNEMSRTALAAVTGRFTWSQVARRCLDLYDQGADPLNLPS